MGHHAREQRHKGHMYRTFKTVYGTVNTCTRVDELLTKKDSRIRMLKADSDRGSERTRMRIPSILLCSTDASQHGKKQRGGPEL